MTDIRLRKNEYGLIFSEKKDKSLELEMRLPKMKDDEIVPELALIVVALALLISGGDQRLQRLIESKVRDIRTLADAEECPGEGLRKRGRLQVPGTLFQPRSRRRQR